MGSSVSFRLYEVADRGADRIKALITRREGNAMVGRSAAIEGLDRDGKTPCFFCLPGPKVRMKSVPLPRSLQPYFETATANNFTKPEVVALAGRHMKDSRSRTAKMTEEQRRARCDRRGNKLPAEDVMERATNKETAWAAMGPALSDLVVEQRVA